jgi:hypothetical protein
MRCTIAVEALVVVGSVLIVASFHCYYRGFKALIGVSVVSLISVVIAQESGGSQVD